MSPAIFRALEYYEWNLRRGHESQQISCPRATYHKDEDRNPSAKVFEDSGVIHCFGCNFRVSIVGLIEHMEGVSKSEATRIAKERFDWEFGHSVDTDLLRLFSSSESRVRILLDSRQVPREERKNYYKRLDVFRAIAHDSTPEVASVGVNKCVKHIQEAVDG